MDFSENSLLLFKIAVTPEIRQYFPRLFFTALVLFFFRKSLGRILSEMQRFAVLADHPIHVNKFVSIKYKHVSTLKGLKNWWATSYLTPSEFSGRTI